jgi:hypothetical protein
MVKVKCIAENSHCIASITVLARKGTRVPGSIMKIGNKSHRILGIIHQPQKTCTKDTY